MRAALDSRFLLMGGCLRSPAGNIKKRRRGVHFFDEACFPEGRCSCTFLVSDPIGRERGEVGEAVAQHGSTGDDAS